MLLFRARRVCPFQCSCASFDVPDFDALAEELKSWLAQELFLELPVSHDNILFHPARIHEFVGPVKLVNQVTGQLGLL
jgi:hypothetical protein